MNRSTLLLLIVAGLWSTEGAIAQKVPQNTVVEHFTNTYCSVCASRNPGFYGNLSAFPAVLHISYYPSSPYPACPFNQMDKAENDARTNYYGIYGGTPRIVVDGNVVSANTPYTDPAIFQNATSRQSAYNMNVQLRQTAVTTGEATITIKKVAGTATAGLNLYAVVTEDTVVFSANNGEGVHFDVFHKSLTGISPQGITGLTAAGDSLKVTYTFAINAGWGRTSVTAMLQDSMKEGVQAARAKISPGATSVPTGACLAPLCMYPVPAGDDLHFSSLPAGYHKYTITNSVGQVVLRGVVYDISVPISLRTLRDGFYVITLGGGLH